MDHCEAAPPNDPSVPSHDATSVTYRDTDNDLIEFKLTVRGLSLKVNGQAEDSWEQLEWLSWESAEMRRQDKYKRERMRLPSEGQVQPIAPPQQQPPKLRDEDIFIGEWCARALFPALPSRTPCSASCP